MIKTKWKPQDYVVSFSKIRLSLRSVDFSPEKQERMATLHDEAPNSEMFC